MARVEVRQLRYKGEPARAGRVEFAVTDALRTELVDDGRLVLVRSFRLGRIGLAERGASRAAASAWRAIRESARHGGASGAESANCVWFADAAEARTLLMRELARGRTPFAWFWVLAVPEWRRETLAQWLGRRFDEAARDASGEAAASLVAEALAAGCVEALAAEILGRVPSSPAGKPAAKPGDERPARESAGTDPSSDSTLHLVGDAACHEAALGIARAIPASLRAILATVARRSELAAFVEVLARGIVLRAHPALALVPARLAVIAAAVARILRLGEGGVPEAAGSSRTASGETPTSVREAARGAAQSASDHAPSTASGAHPATAGTPQATTPPTDQPRAPVDLSRSELRSAAAGLFLAIIPLVRLGWREWLAERPHMLLHQPGPRLLQRIAAHYRVPAADSLWSQLPAVDVADEPPAELEQALFLWRAGLDGWLRRKARLRLADLVLRPGWILPGVETTLVRFPLQAIEIGLRRLALDGDPGWVDWLGHSYRLVYRDRPLLGPEPA